MNWLERMNWSFLDDEVATRVWDEARRLFFEEDQPLQTAFFLALKGEGFGLSDLEALDVSGRPV